MAPAAVTQSADNVVVSAAHLREVVTALFVKSGVGAQSAERMASALVEADQQGIGSHGVSMAPMYVERLDHGSVSKADLALVVHDQDAVAVLDADHMLGHLAADQAMALAVEKAGRFGVGAVAVRHAFHFGVAGRYALQAARSGCIGVAMCNTRPMMAAPGGLQALVGNNPLAIAAPSGDGPPILLDMAMSEVALAKVRGAARRGEAIPASWAVGPDGASTTDPDIALKGMLSPVGGGKGFALALLVDVLCGLLSGGAWGDAVKPLYGDFGQPNDCAFLFVALDIAHFRILADFLADADDVRTRVKAAPRADGREGLVPGDERAAHASRQSEEVAVERAVLQQLAEFAASRGVDASSLGFPAATFQRVSP